MRALRAKWPTSLGISDPIDRNSQRPHAVSSISSVGVIYRGEKIVVVSVLGNRNNPHILPA